MTARSLLASAAAAVLVVAGCDSVVDPPRQETLSVTPLTVTVSVGATALLTAQFTDTAGNTTTPQTVDWTSSNPFVATVDTDGVVTGLCGGVVTITATAEGKTAQADVTVDPPVDAAPAETYIVWSPRVMQFPGTEPLRLTVRTPDTQSTVSVDLASTSTTVPMCRVATHTYELTLTSMQSLFNYTLGDLHNFVGFLELGTGFRGNLFINVQDAGVPDVTVTALSATVQHTDRVVNLRYDDLLLESGNLPGVVQSFYESFPDDYDFIAVVEQVESFNNRGYFSVRNDTRGIGLPQFDNGALYGSAARLQGLIRFPIATFFDLGETAAPHEIGHRWINFLQYPPLGASAPHWPISSLAHGIMGFNIPGSFVGGQFPFALEEQPNGDYLLTCVGPGTDFLDLELYLMGVLPPDSVGEHFVFTDQNQGSALTCGGTLRGPVQRFTVANVIAADGARDPAWPNAQRDFRIATIVLSAGRMLTAREMAFFDHMAARGSATEELWFTSGFASGMSKPFYVATGGRGTLETVLQ